MADMILKTSYLDQINTPEDLRKVNPNDLQTVADEVRDTIIDAVSETGGHLGAGLGVVELTTAIHYVFNTPDDRLIWDVGHQCYPHKVLTGRKDRLKTLRQGGGLSGFTKRCESVYDPFGAGHASTSISAGHGMAVARNLSGKDNHVICVIGDGSISAGMAYEAMNNAGAENSKLIVILNDNEMSIAPPVGAMSNYLARLIANKHFMSVRELASAFAHKLPKPLYKAARRAEEYARGMVTGGTLFEELGFYYVGLVDGHNMDHLVPILRNIRDAKSDRPILIHCVTQKGKGFAPAENATDKMHGVSSFDKVTGLQDKKISNTPAYTSVFAENLIQAAEKDDKVVAVTAAMPTGTGLDKFGKLFPKRCFDVGMAEQHAVTFAAGMATEGYKPFVAIYSTFLQRAYDQVVHDVCIQNLPVRFMLDRAGLVGADGATHAGSFDIAYLGCLPNIVLMAPSDEAELDRMVATMTQYNDGPIACRIPRGNGVGVDRDDVIEPVEIGKARIVQQGSDTALISYGTRLQECLEAAEKMAQQTGAYPTVIDARFAKPLDEELFAEIAKTHRCILTVEEGSVGGFGSLLLHFLANEGLLDRGLVVRSMVLPDLFLDHDKPERQYQDAGLDAESILQKICELQPDVHDLKVAAR